MASTTPPAASPLRLHSLDEVLKMFPEQLRPSRAKLEDTANAYGCYRDLWGKKAFTDEDVETLMDYARGKPTDADTLAKLGPGRLYAAVYPRTLPGYMVCIADQLVHDGTVFIGFAPDKGVGDLLQLVQFGSPEPLAIIHFFPATPSDVDLHRNALKQWQCRTDNTNWFMRSTAVNKYILGLRLTNENLTNEDADNG